MPDRNGFPWPAKTPPQKPIDPKGPPISNPPGKPQNEPPTDDETGEQD